MTNEQCHPILCQRQARILWGTNYSSGDLQGNSKLLNCYLLPLLLTASTLHNNGCILNFYGVFFLIGGTLQNCVQWPLYQITSKPCQLFKTKRSYSVGVVTHRNQFYNVNTHASSYTLANITKVDIKAVLVGCSMVFSSSFFLQHQLNFHASVRTQALQDTC